MPFIPSCLEYKKGAGKALYTVSLEGGNLDSSGSELNSLRVHKEGIIEQQRDIYFDDDNFSDFNTITIPLLTDTHSKLPIEPSFHVANPHQ